MSNSFSNVIQEHDSYKLYDVEIYEFMKLDPTNTEDMEILAKWTIYFDNNNIPYVVQNCGDSIKLWKELKVA